MTSYECGQCYLADTDLPPGHDPESVFVRRDGQHYCRVCAQLIDEGVTL